MTEEDYIKHWRARAISAEIKVVKLRKEVAAWKCGYFVFGITIIILTWIAR